MTVSLLDVSTYLPGEPIGAEYYAQFAESDDLRDNVMFRAPKFRHHVAEDETAIDMVERAAAGSDRTPRSGRHRERRRADHPHPAARHAVLRRRRRDGASPWHETELGARSAQRRMRGVRARAEGGPQPAGVRRRATALIAVAQNAAGQVFDQPTVRRKAQASVPGDGAAVGLVTLSDESPILDVECRTYGEYAGDMTIAVDPPRKWWQPGPGELHIGFTESKITKVLARGNRQVPEVAYAVCDRIGMQPKDLDLLVTNQPNRVFLRNWREALELPKERHVDTFDDCGNLFAAGIPVNLDRAISDGTLKKGDVVMMAAFAHAGDFAGAAAIKWGGRD